MSAWGRLPPAGDPIDASERRAALELADPERTLRDGLRAWLAADEIQLFASGRAALRALLAGLASRSGRHEVVIPAYCCFSVPAAAVAAGLRVRLVDVDARGRVDAQALARLPIDGAAAIVVANLFGIPEPMAKLSELAEKAGALADAGRTVVRVSIDAASDGSQLGAPGCAAARWNHSPAAL